jgi:hypothetical protein
MHIIDESQKKTPVAFPARCFMGSACNRNVRGSILDSICMKRAERNISGSKPFLKLIRVAVSFSGSAIFACKILQNVSPETNRTNQIV